jgi:CBS domain-containing membrane protein
MSQSAITEWLTRFAPHPSAPQWRERIRRSIGALIGIAFTGLSTHAMFGQAGEMPLLVAPMGASAVLLFGASDSPLAQPWSILGGNLVSAVVGVACARWIEDPVTAASVAIALAICAMFACRCVHPPSGAVALTAVLGGPTVHALGFSFVAVPIAFESTALLSLALVFHSLTGHRYPRAMAAAALDGSRIRAPSPGEAILGPSAQPGSDISIGSRDKTFEELTCEDVMSTTVRAVPASMERRAAWELLNRHRVSMLPVVDAMNRLVGMVTHHELEDLPLAGMSRAWLALRGRFVRRSAIVEGTVEAVMADCIHAVHLATPLVNLVHIFTDHAYHDVPVLNDDRRLVGVVKHSDMIRMLHRETRASRFFVDAR